MQNFVNSHIKILEAKPYITQKFVVPLSAQIPFCLSSFGCLINKGKALQNGITAPIGANLKASLPRINFANNKTILSIKLFIGIVTLLIATTIKAQSVDTVFTTNNSGISYNIVNAINVDANNRLFIGTEYGLTIYENNTWQILRAEETLLPENSIRTIYKDTQNQMWLGGFRNTPSIFNNNKLELFTLAPELSNHIKDFIEVEQNGETIFYFATESGLGIYNLANQTWQVLNLTSAYIESPNFTSLAYNNNIGLCAGTLNGGLVIVRNNGQVETYFGEGLIPDNTILDVAIDENNLIWLASPAGGLITFNGTSFESITPFNSNIHSEFISCLWVKNGKDVWFGTNSKGLGHLKDGEFTHYNTYNSILLSDKINDLFLQKDSIMWAATDVGLAKLCVFDKILTASTFSKVDDLIYPNPASSKIYIKHQFYNEVHIYNSYGAIVYQSNKSVQQIAVNHFDAGIYYVAIKFNNIISVNKLSIL